MPLYEYQCESCGHRLEALQKFTEEPLHECPHCHKDSLNKLISATNFQLKGTGWYATDFRDKDKPKTQPPKDEEKKSSGGSDTGSSTAGSTDSGNQTGSSGGSQTAQSNNGVPAST
jgi:putative FmdB family regulatory protein